jgi:tetratricopeptide (TPR) repeat protein
MGEYSDAIESALKAIKINQKLASAHYVVGRVRLIQNKFNEALKSFEEAIKQGYQN